MTEPNADTSATDAEVTTDQPKPTDTVDFWKAKAREQEKRAKDNAEAAKRLAEIENANKTEAEKAQARIAELETEMQSVRLDALRRSIAAKHQITDQDDIDLFLTGSDEATLTKQAERLTARESERKKTGNHVPREGAPSKPSESDERAAVRSLFGSGG